MTQNQDLIQKSGGIYFLSHVKIKGVKFFLFHFCEYVLLKIYGWSCTHCTHTIEVHVITNVMKHITTSFFMQQNWHTLFYCSSTVVPLQYFAVYMGMGTLCPHTYTIPPNSTVDVQSELKFHVFVPFIIL